MIGFLLAAVPVAPPSPGETPLLRDIAPPVYVFPYPVWMVVAAGAAAAIVVGLLAFAIVRWYRSRPGSPPPTAREIALEELETARASSATRDPYEFSIEVSDVLRTYVVARYGLPATRQTSPEFLAAVSDSPQISEAMRAPLARFLEKVDLIKFARMEAVASDNAELVELAIDFVRGESP